MAPALAKPARKRNRKRKRRAASSSASSSSSDSSSSDEESPKVATTPVQKKQAPESSESSESSDSSESESESDSSSSKSSELKSKAQALPTVIPPRHFSPSPPPPIAERPSLIPFGSSEKDSDALQKETALKEKFRKFWMASVADGFKDDLEQIRKEPNLGPSRLSLLIDSLASGADVFASRSDEENAINEMEVVLEGHS